jgi:hypothetical protein
VVASSPQSLLLFKGSAFNETGDEKVIQGKLTFKKK